MTRDLPGGGGANGDDDASTKRPTTSTDALLTSASPLFSDSSTERRIPRRWVVSWALWDWGGAAFNAVITTFVFTVYLTGSLFVDPALVAARDAETDLNGPAHAAVTAAEAPLSSGLGWGLAIAGVIVALLAPVLGRSEEHTSELQSLA